jgi:hypothetical protein
MTMPSNKPFERTGHLMIQGPPPIGLCLPLKGSVSVLALSASPASIATLHSLLAF